MNIRTLTDLRDAVDRAIEYAKECDVDPATVPVTLQIERPDDRTIWTDDNVELHYDNNATASGAVLTAWKDEG